VTWPATSPIPPSDEQINEHAERHPCGTNELWEHACPCGQAALIVCHTCGMPVFLGVQKDGVICEHAKVMLERFK
jgi:hypothetical protein